MCATPVRFAHTVCAKPPFAVYITCSQVKDGTVQTLINVAASTDAQLESAAGLVGRATRGSKRSTGAARNDRARLLQRGRSGSNVNLPRAVVARDYDLPPPLPPHSLPQPPSQPSSNMLMNAATCITQRPDDISAATPTNDVLNDMAAARTAAGMDPDQGFHPLRVLRPYREAAAISTLRGQVPLREEQVRREVDNDFHSRPHSARLYTQQTHPHPDLTPRLTTCTGDNALLSQLTFPRPRSQPLAPARVRHVRMPRTLLKMWMRTHRAIAVVMTTCFNE